jgi:hypothetical protein
MGLPDVDPLVPLSDIFPDQSKRWRARAARAGRIPGAVRVGKIWFIRRSDYERWINGTAASTPTVDTAIANLRAAGVA